MDKKHFHKIFPALCIGLLLGWLAPPFHARASTLAVNTTDDADDGVCDTRHCSLREAINAAAFNGGPDEIIFLFGEGGVHTIHLESPLPPLVDQTTLDGTRSPYFGGVPITVLDFGALESHGGLSLSTDGNTVRSLSIVGNGTGAGIWVGGNSNRIEGNYIGVEPGGAIRGNETGINIYTYHEFNIIYGNLISGNETGIQLYGDNQTVEGNVIGLNTDGSTAPENQQIGIEIYSKYNHIGSANPGGRNVISGHMTGIHLHENSDGNFIQNNYIGTNAEGTAAVPNSFRGIHIQGVENMIGGDEPGTGNVISGNGTGIHSCADWLFVRRNKIGTDASGSRPIPNTVGIDIACGGDSSIIGGSIPDMQNLIAFNSSTGILVSSGKHFYIENNVIRRNGGDGIYVKAIPPSDTGARIKITRNSIYSNGGLGIKFQADYINRGTEPPEITRASSLYASGRACPHCRIELFLADPDPSGYGEGKTFLIEVNTIDDGTFNTRFPDIGACKLLTATATDGMGNTSEFSRTVGVGICFRIPIWTPWALIIGGAGGGSGLMLVIAFLPRRLRRRGTLSIFGLGLLGGLLGAGLAIVILALPFVQVEPTQEKPSGQVPPEETSCGQYLDPSLIRPEDGSLFETGTDVLFELSPQPDPPGKQTRWFLEVTGPGQTTVRKEMTGNAVRLSELGFDPGQGGHYYWGFYGERSQAGIGLWEPLCQEGMRRMFTIAEIESVKPTSTMTATLTPTPTQTGIPSAPTATLLANAHCRRGAGADYSVVTTLPQGSVVPIVGRNPEGGWWQVQVPGTQTQCWIAGENADTSGDTSGVPVVQSPPLGCWVWTGNKNECKVPCPEGAQPGGACEP